MAAPNLIGATTINGKTTGTVLSNTSPLLVLNNVSSSGKALKVNTVTLANRSANAITGSLVYYTAASLGGTPLEIAANISIPGLSSFTAIDKQTQYYLEEDKSLGAVASSANTLVVTVSYEDIS
jgi:hypothetical protein